MKKAIFIFVLAALGLSFINNPKKVLIIGDSISLGYFPFVKTALGADVQLTHNPGNAQHTGTGLRLIDQWLADSSYDVIAFNWGLWDLCYRHPDSKEQGQRDKLNGEITYTVDRYEANLELLVKRLKKTGAKLIFVTSTFIPPGEAGRFEGDEIVYNDAARKIMKKYDVAVCDLHKYSVGIHSKHKKAAGDVHYTSQGYKELSNHITHCIQESLKK